MSRISIAGLCLRPTTWRRWVNRLDDSLVLWTAICSSKLLSKTQLILFLSDLWRSPFLSVLKCLLLFFSSWVPSFALNFTQISAITSWGLWKKNRLYLDRSRFALLPPLYNLFFSAFIISGLIHTLKGLRWWLIWYTSVRDVVFRARPLASELVWRGNWWLSFCLWHGCLVGRCPFMTTRRLVIGTTHSIVVISIAGA